MENVENVVDNVIKWIENDLWAIITLVHTNQVLCVREC